MTLDTSPTPLIPLVVPVPQPVIPSVVRRDRRLHNRCGIYIAIWQAGPKLVGYVGKSAKLPVRGLRFQEYLDQALFVSDEAGALDKADALVLERMAWLTITEFGGVRLNNGAPFGASVSLDRYAELRRFWIACLLKLRNGDGYFSDMPEDELRGVSLVEQRYLDDASGDDGQPHDLRSHGLRARGIVTPDGAFRLFAGSQIRKDTVGSLSCVPTNLRGEFLAAGILVDRGFGCFELLRDLAFESRSAASRFVTGTNGQAFKPSAARLSSGAGRPWLRLDTRPGRSRPDPIGIPKVG